MYWLTELRNREHFQYYAYLCSPIHILYVQLLIFHLHIFSSTFYYGTGYKHNSKHPFLGDALNVRTDLPPDKFIYETVRHANFTKS